MRWKQAREMAEFMRIKRALFAQYIRFVSIATLLPSPWALLGLRWLL